MTEFEYEDLLPTFGITVMVLTFLSQNFLRECDKSQRGSQFWQLVQDDRKHIEDLYGHVYDLSVKCFSQAFVYPIGPLKGPGTF